MKEQISIYWFRQDLRIADNPALYEACKSGKIMPIYILDEENCNSYSKMGAASKVWLHHSLLHLNKKLKNTLSFYVGDPLAILQKLCKHYNIENIYWNRCYEPWRMHRDTIIKNTLSAENIKICSYNASLLWEPWTIKKNDDTPYKVFTPFLKYGCFGAALPREVVPKPSNIDSIKDVSFAKELDNLELLPVKNRWDKEIISHWNVGEENAMVRFKDFLADGIHNYKDGRNLAAEQKYVSKMSSYLHFGEISPHQIYYAIKEMHNDRNTEHFLSELGWREFSYNQLYYNNEIYHKNIQSKFDKFPWQYEEKNLQAWQKGETGIPFVDAAMKELWQTGYMHNRLRMVVASFLVKNLLINWHHGERWFWDCLFDADLANNSASWQWVAGCGLDSAPYFRIFNPVLQGQKFDPDGLYTKKYLPQLKKLPVKYLFNPWEAPSHVLKEAGIVLGVNYPRPIVDLKISRDKALSSFKALSE
jgi:deoxyribodipyrimidine photo-lyase